MQKKTKIKKEYTMEQLYDYSDMILYKHIPFSNHQGEYVTKKRADKIYQFSYFVFSNEIRHFHYFNPKLR